MAQPEIADTAAPHPAAWTFAEMRKRRDAQLVVWCEAERKREQAEQARFREWIAKATKKDEVARAAQAEAEIARNRAEAAPSVHAPAIAKPRIVLYRGRSAQKFLEVEQQWHGVRTLNYWRGAWWRWDGKRWKEEDADIAIEAKVQKFLMENDRDEGGNRVPFEPTPKHVNEVFKSVQRSVHVEATFAQPGWFVGNISGKVTKPPIENPRMLVAMENGLLYLPTRELLSHSPRFWSPNVLDYAYDPDAQCPTWLQFLDDLWGCDVGAKQTLQEMIGLFLTDLTEYQKGLMIKGPRRSGKGTIGRVIQGLVGPENYIASSMPVFADRFGLENWLDKKVAVFPEATLDSVYRAGMAVIVERLKSITGEDTVQVDRKNIKLTGVTLRARVAIFSNDILKFDDVTGTLPTRLICLELTRSFFGQEDIHLSDKLLAERVGILNWALDGFDRLRGRGQFAQPESGLELARTLSELGTDIQRFIEERCELGPHEVRSMRLFDAWRAWCEGQQIRYGWSAPQFISKLRSVFPNLHTSRPSKDNPGRATVIHGIRIRPM
jgi:putative DNA primase/helicase